MAVVHKTFNIYLFKSLITKFKFLIGRENESHQAPDTSSFEARIFALEGGLFGCGFVGVWGPVKEKKREKEKKESKLKGHFII